MHPLFDGAAYVAAKAGVPIIPVGIGGSARVMPRHAKLIHPHKVCVVIGEPIWVADTTETDRGSKRVSRQAVREATEELRVELQRLFDLAQSARRLIDSGRGSLVRASSAGEELHEGVAEVQRIVGAAELTGRVHRQLRHADVDGRRSRAGWT